PEPTRCRPQSIRCARKNRHWLEESILSRRFPFVPSATTTCTGICSRQLWRSFDTSIFQAPVGGACNSSSNSSVDAGWSARKASGRVKLASAANGPPANELSTRSEERRVGKAGSTWGGRPLETREL